MFYFSLYYIIMYLAIIILTIFIFSISKAICDVSECCFDNSKLAKLKPQFWNKHKSWVNKWKGGNPANGEKFPGSSTFLVWLTDAWHLFNLLSYVSMFILGIFSILFFDTIYLLILPFIFGLISFEFIYRWLKHVKL